MSKLFRKLLRRTLLHKKSNLQNLDDPYITMGKLLARKKIRGILDAGASNGHVSQRLVKHFQNATCYLFEPNPAYEQTLNTLASQDSRMSPQPMALSSGEGRMTLNVTQGPGRSSLLEASTTHIDQDHAKWQVRQRVQVPVVTVDQWRRRAGSPPIDLMKLDIQAGELQALRGSRQTLEEHTRVIYTEAFFNPLYRGGALFGHIDRFLRRRGFELYNFYNPRSDERGRLLWANAMFIHPARVTLTP